MVTEFSPLDWKSARVNAGLKQGEVAKELGIKQSRLSEFEAGKRDLPQDMKVQLMRLIVDRQSKLRSE